MSESAAGSSEHEETQPEEPIGLTGRPSCYIIRSQSRPGRTYCGYSTNVIRRLRQHNGEISGGAKSTRNGRPWELAAVVIGFRNHVEGLRFEYALKHVSDRKKRPTGRGIQYRKQCLVKLLKKDRWTSKSGDITDVCLDVVIVDPDMRVDPEEEGLPTERLRFFDGRFERPQEPQQTQPQDVPELVVE